MCISCQIIREYLAVMTRWQLQISEASVYVLIRDMKTMITPFSVYEDGYRVTSELYRLLETVPASGRQVHDANIVATMTVHGIKRLLTHNVSDFIRFADVIEIIPLTD